jgi:glycosyltransferase involved in cell wall biosynthesis
MNAVQASIIIPTKDKLSRLRLVLQALEPQLTPAVELILVFDGCTPETLRGFEETELACSPIPIVLERNVGRSAARNRGLRRAQGEVILFLDDDRIPSPDFVARHLARHASGDCVLLGERKNIIFPEDEIDALYRSGVVRTRLQEVIAGATRDTAFNLLNDWILSRPLHPIRWLPFFTGNASVKRRFLEQIGLFDEAFTGWGYEDTDLGYRLSRLGLPFVRDPALMNYHLVHRFSASQVKGEELRNMRYLIGKFPEDAALRRTLTAINALRRFVVIKHFLNERRYNQPRNRVRRPAGAAVPAQDSP